MPVFIFISSAIFIYFKGQNTKINRAFISFVFTMAAWSLAVAVFYLVKSTAAMTCWGKMVYVTASLIPPAFVLFSYAFPGAGRISLFKKMCLFLPCVVLCVLYFATPLIVDRAFEENGLRGFIYGPLKLLWDAQYKGILAIGFYRFTKLYFINKGIIREKIKYIIIANFYLSFLGGIPNVVLPAFKIFNFIWLGPAFSLIWLFIIAFAIARYRLVDVRVGFSNFGIFSGIYVLVLGLPIYIYAMGHKLTALIVALVLATLGPFLYLRFKDLAEAKILEEEKRYQEALLQASKALRALNSTDKITHLVSISLFKAMRLSKLSIYLKDNDQYALKECLGSDDWKKITLDLSITQLLEEQGTVVVEELEFKPAKVFAVYEPVFNHLRKNAVSVVVPIRSDHAILGVILLGDKNNQSLFSSKDIFTLNVLSDYAALALQNAK